ncbi:2,3-diaminopropionate biosynthesis protein SbnB [Streptomyces palmae]|uniref:2,3-diaminopropionate biosynthesis protein SbnB n=1 Tax=Streptomyces palmae TaxID=1701085 RepID=A0A4Z0H9K6_9ACTN|nr:2,3-diaminopropionate biosynthesis protein SbnB [Streptomyces palmae]TGB08743.1 2,3-diaminopropionate biosynthesis protein SbnB [Streptomyces palmae]
MHIEVPPFGVISGAQVQRTLQGQEREVVALMEAAYRAHGNGDTVNPPSYFLRFPDRPTARIIALPASLGGESQVDGLKWISSFPENVAAGIPRASAVLLLNDRTTGYPMACLESSIISASRTAGSAALAADALTRRHGRPRRIGFFGVGLIARYIHTYLAGTGWTFDEVGVYDLLPEHAAGFGDYLGRSGAGKVVLHESAEDLIRSSDLVVFATVAGTPHVTDPSWFDHHPLVLHISLRDLSPEIVLDSVNIVDDVEHCLKADTSPHLAEQLSGNRDFLHGTLFDVLEGRAPDHDGSRTLVFSPFGLGILDLALGKHVYDRLSAAGELTVVPDFFHELSRYGTGG